MRWQSASGRASVGRNRRACLGALLVDVNPARAAVPLAREPRGAAAASGPGGRRRKREKSLHQENLEDVVTTLRPTVREDQEADSQERVCTETRSRLSSTTSVTGPRRVTPTIFQDRIAAPVHAVVRQPGWHLQWCDAERRRSPNPGCLCPIAGTPPCSWQLAREAPGDPDHPGKCGRARPSRTTEGPRSLSQSSCLLTSA